MKTQAIQLVNSDWGNGSRVGDEPSSGVIPAAVMLAGKQPRAHGYCSPVISLGVVDFEASRQRGGECFDRDELMVTPVEQLTF